MPLALLINRLLELKEFEKSFSFVIYPNPSREKFVVRSWEFIEGTLIKVFNTMGKELLNEVLEKNNQIFDISNLNTGNLFYLH